MATRFFSVHSLSVRRATTLLATLMLAGLLANTSPSDRVTAAPKEEKKESDEPNPQTEGDAPNRKAQMAAMRRVGTGLMVTITDDGQSELDVIPDPLFRSNDLTREEFDGTIWGYGKTGRPAALLTLALQPVAEGRYKWLYELNSLTSRPVMAKVPGYPIPWSTRKSGLDIKDIPDAPAAAEKEAGRTRQLRDLSSRFTGYEKMDKGPNTPMERYELRLQPRPIYRYSDPEHGLVDGAIFLMTHSTNPEVIMVIELLRDGEKSTWKSGFTRCAWAEVHVELDGKEFWTQPHLHGTSPADTYWLFVRPIPEGELERD